MTVLAATSWNTNADMIADAVVPLGYIKPSDRVIDVTYGGGKWWTKYQHPPELFIGCVETQAAVHEQYAAHPESELSIVRVVPDYRNMRVSSNDYQEQFDVVVFDPPYVAMGGRATSTIPDFVDRYGLENAGTTPALLQADNMLGLRECTRVVSPGGLILVKCQNYISSGKLFPAVHMTWKHATEVLGLAVQDELTMVGHVRQQPPTTKCKACDGEGELFDDSMSVVGISGGRIAYAQCDACEGKGGKPRSVQHARQNASTLFVFRKPKPRRTKK